VRFVQVFSEIFYFVFDAASFAGVAFFFQAYRETKQAVYLRRLLIFARV